MGKRARLSQPNLHIAPVKAQPQSQSSIESQDSAGTYEGTQSTATPCPPCYSPASQRSRYSQPNLPTLMIPYSDQHRHSVSPDRRTRMSQPTLNTSYSGINFAGTMRGARLSYSSLRASGDNSINLQIEEERLSTPNVNSLGGSVGYRDNHGGGRLSQPDVRRMPRVDPVTGKRERLSQPTLVTGDFYPGRVQQRLSQPCLSAWNEHPIVLQSPIKLKRFGPSPVKRDRLSQLDFGGSRYRNIKDPNSSLVKFNRDRFSIPELETHNDLRLMAGTPKQRYSLDSQLNPDGRGTRRLLPIASSPISEHQAKNGEYLGLKGKMSTEGLESVLVTSATPIFPSQDRQFLAPILKTTPAPSIPPSSSAAAALVINRERMSVPEIRNSSLRRLLDSPIKQRHSITGNLRQSLMSQAKTQELLLLSQGDKTKARASIDEAIEKLAKIEVEKVCSEANDTRKEKPKHIQRHYSYTYDVKDDTTEVIGRLSVAMPRKKYLESNFDENEQVITTVIETEVPMILSSPKYMKKTHVYSSEAPKWMRKCLENESPKVVRKNDKNDVARINQRNTLRAEPGQRPIGQTSPDKTTGRKTSPKRSSTTKLDAQYLQPKTTKDKPSKTIGTNLEADQTPRNTYVSIKPSNDTGEHKYEVSVDANWPKQDIGQFYNVDCDSDSEDSTSI